MGTDTGVLNMREGRYFALVLFCHGDAEGRDWLASVWRDHDGPWHVTYRFRYHVSPDVFDGEDEKAFYDTVARDMTEERVCAVARQMGDLLVEKGFNEKLDVVEPKTNDPAKVFELLRGKEWFHFKIVEGTSR